MKNKWRDPKPEELDTPEFNAIWETIKHWDIGLPFDLAEDGTRLYGEATGNHVVSILDSLRAIGKLRPTVKKSYSGDPNNNPRKNVDIFHAPML